MAITTVPQISGPSFGGVIYGMSLSANISSSSPSILTLNIVNENGQYSVPSLNQPASVNFGSFRFNGVIWSYQLKTTAQEKTLEVQIIDNSIILDRYYVLLWKRGLLELNGTKRELTKTFDFSDESLLVPVKAVTDSGFAYTKFEEKSLGSERVTRSSRKLGSARKGNVIIVGEEKYSNSDCDFPDTWYTFGDLKRGIPSSIGGNYPSAPGNLRNTYEGTLREVLSSWCADLGYDFIWDYSSNQLYFFDVKRGISSVPDIQNSKIISKSFSSSMEGTFAQYSIAYTAMPKEPIKTLSGNFNYTILRSVPPFGIGYLSNRNGTIQELAKDDDEGKWGFKRGKKEFLTSAFLGYVSKSLREIYNLINKHWTANGYVLDGGENIDNKKNLLNFLKSKGLANMISDYESFDGKDLPNYKFAYVTYDQGMADKWSQAEQELLNSLGKYYRIPDRSGSFWYCNDTSIAEISISVDPEGTVNEESSQDFNGQRIYSRSGVFSHSQNSALEDLKYDQLAKSIEKCLPVHIPLQDGGLLISLNNVGLLSDELKKTVSHIVMYPNEDFIKEKIGFSAKLTRGANDLESTVNDIEDANTESGRKNCDKFEETVRRGSCLSAEEEAREKALSKIQQADKYPDSFVSGLLDRIGYVCDIELSEGNLRLAGPADGGLQVVSQYTINVTKISENTFGEFIFSDGSPGGASDVAEIRILNNNITNSVDDLYQSKRDVEFERPPDIVNNQPQEKATYVFAGEPIGVNLTPKAGLSNLDVSLSSEGFTTQVTFSTRPPKLAKTDTILNKVHSQFNRTSFNSR